MRTWAKGTARAALLTAGFVALGSTSVFPGAAFADTDGNHSILGGNSINLPISAPIDASGNAVGVLGTAFAKSKGGASVENGNGSGTTQKTSGKHSIGGGNTVNAPISIPVNACGNAVAVLGAAGAGCEGGASVQGGSGDGGSQTTSGKHSILGGNTVNAPIKVPVNACGNAVAVLGASGAGCKGGSSVGGGDDNGGYGTTGSGSQMTSGKYSIAGGNTVKAPISAPVNVCGNAVGNAVAGCKGGASVEGGSGDGGSQTTSGKHSILGGNLIKLPIKAPVNVCGNAVAVLGHAGAFCEGGTEVSGDEGNGNGGEQKTSGEHSVGGGNEVTAPVEAPVDVCGNSVAVLGTAIPGCGEKSQPTPPGDGDDCNPCQGGGGDDGYDYGTRTPVPAVDDALGKLPVSPGSALPATAQQVTGAATSALPGQAAKPVTDLTQNLPAQAPQTGRSADLPPIPANLPAGLPGSLTSALPAGLPTGGPVPPSIDGQAPQTLPAKATQLTDQLPVQPNLPIGSDAVTGKVGELQGQAGALTGKVGEATGAVTQVKDQVTQMAPMSASEPIGARPGATSMSLLVLGGVLAGAAAAAAFARRVMTGRR